METIIYAARIKDKETLKKSSSGGMFTILSDLFLKHEGAIACSIYDNDKKEMKYSLVTDYRNRDAARGSKYIQSNPVDIFRLASKWLEENPKKKLLFVGTGCTADGFNSYVKSKNLRDRVTIVDIICHGSPSPLIWKEYAQALEKREGTIDRIDFKDKRNGWIKPTAIAGVGGKEISLKKYVDLFYSGCILRPSCYVCPYTTMKRNVDITIGDFWHIEEKIPSFYDSLGNSLVLIHTEQGKELFESVKQSMDYVASNKDECWQYNLEKPTKKPWHRNTFWKNYERHGMEYVIEKYSKPLLEVRLKGKIKKMLLNLKIRV